MIKKKCEKRYTFIFFLHIKSVRQKKHSSTPFVRRPGLRKIPGMAPVTH